jgi:hypothetical protein
MRIFRLTCVALLLAGTGTAFAQPDSPAPPPDQEPIPEEQPIPQEAPPPTPDETPAPDTDVDVDVNAQPTYTPPPPPQGNTTVVAPIVTPTPVEEPVAEENLFQRYGISVQLGGGVSGFTSDSMDDATDIGGDWDVRAIFGARSPLAIEAAYIGSAQSIDALGLDNDAVLLGNGAQGDLRLNGLFGESMVQPYLFGGVAWRHYNLTNESFNTSDISDSDDVLEFPVGAGIGFQAGGFNLDVRGEFRPTLLEDMVPQFEAGDPDDAAAMHRWGVNANIGLVF